MENEIPASVWEKKDRGDDAQKAQAWATTVWTSDKYKGNKEIKEIADGMFQWLRKRREEGLTVEKANNKTNN